MDQYSIMSNKNRNKNQRPIVQTNNYELCKKKNVI